MLSEAEEPIRASLLNQTCTALAYWFDGKIAIATVVRLCWEEDKPGEIVNIVVTTDLCGRGYGKQIIHILQEELLRRGEHSLLVEMANAALENVACCQN